MSLLDRSPGGFIVVTNAILYAVVLLEVWMLTTESIAAMALTMGVIIVVSALLCRWMLHLLGPEDHALDFEPQRAKPEKATQPSRVATGSRPVTQ